MNLIPKVTSAVELPGLEFFANKVICHSQGTFDLSKFAYLNDEPLFSTACLTPPGRGKIARNTEVSLFDTPIGMNGQGFGLGVRLMKADTNLRTGRDESEEAFPANRAYAAVSGGFVVQQRTKDGEYLPLDEPSDEFAVASSVIWSWYLGDGPRHRYEPIRFWPLQQPRSFPTPMILPPHAVFGCRLFAARELALKGDYSRRDLCVTFTLQGYMLTQVR